MNKSLHGRKLLKIALGLNAIGACVCSLDAFQGGYVRNNTLFRLGLLLSMY